MTKPHLDDDDLPEPPQVRQLRYLVSALVLVLIAGVVTVAATLVIRLASIGPAPAPAPISAETLSLPAGERITAIGRAGAEILVTTEDAAGAERLRAFDAATGAPRSETPIRRD